MQRETFCPAFALVDLRQSVRRRVHPLPGGKVRPTHATLEMALDRWSLKLATTLVVRQLPRRHGKWNTRVAHSSRLQIRRGSGMSAHILARSQSHSSAAEPERRRADDQTEASHADHRSVTLCCNLGVAPIRFSRSVPAKDACRYPANPYQPMNAGSFNWSAAALSRLRR